jgi:hypothetical protein
MKDDEIDAATRAIVQRTQERYEKYRRRTIADTDRLFTGVFVVEWIIAVVLSLIVSPYAWEGRVRAVHYHVWVALLLGGAIVSLPLYLTTRHRGQLLTRHVVAAAQALMVALVIHLSGGRIETHFAVFCSLAALAFYLDPWVLLTAAVFVAGDHFVRGLVWPESVYGISNPEWWRFGEHAGWVVVCVGSLVYMTRRHLRDWLAAAEEGGLIEALAEGEWRKQSVLDRAAASKAGSDG